MSRPRNDHLLRALLREPTEYTPIWLMRQAGRYLPEYLETRKRAGDFMTLCKTPSLAAEVTLQPLARYDLDAAIVFSDILTVPDAMGLGLYFEEGGGPRLQNPLREEWDIRDLFVPDPVEHLSYVLDTVAEVRRALDNSVPLIGFAGTPFTLACYMVEGASSQDFLSTKRMLYDRPDLFHHILEVNAAAVTAYLNAQIEAGVQAVMIFDSWGGILSTPAYREFSLQYVQRVLSGLVREKDGQRIPSIVYTRGGGLWLEETAALGCDALGLDWCVDLAEARRRVGERVALQGNLDPAVLLAAPERIVAETVGLLERFGAGQSGHIFNLGHGISRWTPPEHVSVLVETVHAYRRPAA